MYNALIKWFSSENPIKSFHFHFELLHNDIVPDYLNFSFLNSLAHMYSNCGYVKATNEVFQRMACSNVVSWTSMIVGFNKVGDVVMACELFDKMRDRNLVTWRMMISGYAKNTYSDEVVDFFSSEKAHGYIVKNNLSLNVNLGSALVDMMQDMKRALWFFSEMRKSGLEACSLSAGEIEVPDLGYIMEGSLLRSDRNHISLHFADTEKNRVLDHFIRNLKLVIPSRVLPYLVEAGFGYIGRYQGHCKIEPDLISTLVERWRPETHIFHLPCGECTITLEDVSMHLGLPVDGDVISGIASGYWIALCRDSLGRVPENFIRGRILINWLDANFRELSADASEDEVKMYARACILQLIGGLLMSDKSRNLVHCMWLRYIRSKNLLLARLPLELEGISTLRSKKLAVECLPLELEAIASNGNCTDGCVDGISILRSKGFADE
ncbi:Detected protein of unknown function [Hibiscus syriacus]|uniref:Aminotransferase-like plant mobile domain-containing protein n=1 Tax=Hibiscus syriacus TaxID=106335 RepID=A0A6A2YZ29_HIBSY|nr:Detected protein of unknown function [Hibiscus syriacus]